MSSAVTLCAEFGRDNLTMSMIAKDADVSRGTLYNKFEDVDGVLAEVWLEVGALWLSELENNIESKFPEPLQRCLAQCITVAPRAPAILEVIEEDIMRAFHGAGSRGRASEVRWAWTMALALGQRFAEQSQLVFNFEMMKTFSDLISQMPDDWPGEFTPVEHNYGPLRIKGAEDEKYERILNATISAITRSGIANTSMMRICRSARVSPAAVTPRFPTYEDVIVEAFNRIVEAVVQENLIAFAPKESDSIAQQFASAINASFSPSRKVWRDFRREIYFALPTRPNLVDPVLAGFKRTDGDIYDILRKVGMPEEFSLATTEWNQMAGVGLSILSDVGVPIRSLNHFAMSSWMAGLLGLG
jgi:AcrR family transcriptional regulator